MHETLWLCGTGSSHIARAPQVRSGSKFETARRHETLSHGSSNLKKSAELELLIMEIPMTAVLYSLLVSVISSSRAEFLHSDPSKETGMQLSAQAAGAQEMCPVSGTVEVCLSASRITRSRETVYVHVCPSDGKVIAWYVIICSRSVWNWWKRKQYYE